MYERKHVMVHAKSFRFRLKVISLAKYIPIKDKVKILLAGKCDTYMTLNHQIILMIKSVTYNKTVVLNKIFTIKGG